MIARPIVLLMLSLGTSAIAVCAETPEPPTYSADLLNASDKGDEQALTKLRGLAESGHAQAQYDNRWRCPANPGQISSDRSSGSTWEWHWS